MNRLLIAVALVALSTPALAVPGTGSPNYRDALPGAGRDYHRYVQPESEQHQKQSNAGNSQTNDPYWMPCHITGAGYNSCD